MSEIDTPQGDLRLRTTIAVHRRLTAATDRLAQDGTDRGASHAVEVAGAVVLVGVIWVAIQALGLDATLGTAITTAVTGATTGGAGG